MSHDVTLTKLDTVHLYVDLNKKILYFDVLNSTYNKNNFITVLEYFKNFWLLAEEQNVKYFLVIKINSIGIYPLTFYNYLVECLKSLNLIFKNHLHSCCFQYNGNNVLTLLKPLFTMYNFVRPLNFAKNYEETIIIFSKPENKLTE